MSVAEVKKSSIVEQAREEIEKEKVAKAVKLLKDKLRDRDAAQTVLNNIDREIAELEMQIDHGNI